MGRLIGEPMGRIVADVTITNHDDPTKSLRCNALVDTGASYLVLPKVWRERLGKLQIIEKAKFETADQTIIEGEICGPVKIKIESFREIFNEVMFIDMQPRPDGHYEPLIGYLILEQSHVAVDLVGHRLQRVELMDLK